MDFPEMMDTLAHLELPEKTQLILMYPNMKTSALSALQLQSVLQDSLDRKDLMESLDSLVRRDLSAVLDKLDPTDLLEAQGLMVKLDVLELPDKLILFHRHLENLASPVNLDHKAHLDLMGALAILEDLDLQDLKGILVLMGNLERMEVMDSPAHLEKMELEDHVTIVHPLGPLLDIKSLIEYKIRNKCSDTR